MIVIIKQNKQNFKKVASVGKDVEYLEHLNIVGGTINWYRHCEKQYRGSSKN